MKEGLLIERIRGCLLGVAVGDALGAPFEHLLPGQTNQQLERIGGYIDDFYPHWKWSAGTWTDDTGMTLASCRALIEHEMTGKPMEECFRRAFKEWVGSDECRNPGGER